MGLSIRYSGVIRDSEIDAATRAVVAEAEKQGFKIVALGDVWGKPAAVGGEAARDLVNRGIAVYNPNGTDRPERGFIYWKARGVLIDPGEGSETFELSFMPYSPELKARLLRDGMEDFSFTPKPQVGGAEGARVESEGDVPVVEFIDRYEKTRKWKRGVDLTSLLGEEGVRPGHRYVMTLSKGHGLQRGEVSYFDVRQSKDGGTRHAYRFFVPFQDPKLLEKFGPGTSYVDSDTKTQYADEFLRAHAGVVMLIDAAKPHMLGLKVSDDSEYYETRDPEKLAEVEEQYQMMTGALAGTLAEKLPGGKVESPALARGSEDVRPAEMKDIFERRRPREVHVRRHARRVR